MLRQKKGPARGFERGKVRPGALGLGARNSAPTPVSHCSVAQRKRAARKPRDGRKSPAQGDPRGAKIRALGFE
jgi:hypothetical protein